MEITKHTHKLAEYCAGIRMERLGPEVREHVKYLLLDFLGLAAKGLSMESTKKVHAMIQKIGGTGDGLSVHL